MCIIRRRVSEFTDTQSRHFEGAIISDLWWTYSEGKKGGGGNMDDFCLPYPISAFYDMYVSFSEQRHGHDNVDTWVL